MNATLFRILTAAIVGGLLGLLAYGAMQLATGDSTWSLAAGAVGCAIGVALAALVATPVDAGDEDRTTREN